MKRFLKNRIIFGEILVIIFFIFLPFIILSKWFDHGSLIYFWDSTVPLEPAKSLKDFFYLWKTNIFPGYSDPAWSWLPYISLYYLFNLIFHSISTSQEVIYWILMSCSLISFYLLSRVILSELNFKNRKTIILSSFLSAILYSFNLYVFYYSFRIFNPQQFILSFLPINILALMKLLKSERDKKSFKHILFWTIAFFLSLFLMIPGFSNLIFYIEYFVFILFFISYELFTNRLLNLKVVVKYLFFILSIFFINLWWFYPMILGLNDSFGAAASIGTNIYFELNSKLSNLLNAFRIIGMPPMLSPIFDWEKYYTINRFFALPLFIFPLLVLVLARNVNYFKNKGFIVFTFIVFLLTLFIVKEANPPFNFITQFAFERIPFFGVFRDAFHKAGLFYIFTYFILVSISISLIYERLFINGLIKRIILALFLAIATLVMIAPFFIFDSIPKITDSSKANKIEFSAKVTIPQEYKNIKPILEKYCQNTIVLSIPKSSILSSAVWRKGDSYIGQDILRYTVNCDFITNQLSSNRPDSFTTSPYLFLQNGQYEQFKKFLVQNNIKVVLYKKDYVSNIFTDIVPIVSEQIKSYLDKANDLQKVYENKSFIIYVLTNTADNQYFSVPKTFIYTNLSLDSADSFKVLSSFSKSSSNIYIDNSSDLKKYKSYINQYIITANCIGCTAIKIKDFVPEENQFIKTIKDYIKLILKKKTTVSKEQELSLGIVKLNNYFADMYDNLQSDDEKSILARIDKYYSQLQLTNKMLSNYNSDIFTINNKSIEYETYINPQFNKLAFITAKGNMQAGDKVKSKLFLVISYQLSIINKLNSSIYKTDFSKNLIRYRLDVPKSGDYFCYVNTRSQDISVSKIQVGNEEFKTLDKQIHLDEGSYKTQIDFKLKNIFNESRIEVSNINSFEINSTLNGFYTLSFDIQRINQPLAIIISKYPLDNSVTINGVKAYNSKNLVFRDILFNNKDSSKNYKKDFNVDQIDPNIKYNLYIIPLQNVKTESSILLNFSLVRSIQNDDIKLYCNYDVNKTINSTTDTIDVHKINPTEYIISLPNDFKNGFISFDNSYSPDWTAYIVDNGGRHMLEHIQSGYANAWFIDYPQKKQIVVEFNRQKKSEIIALSGTILFAISLLFYLYGRKKYE